MIINSLNAIGSAESASAVSVYASRDTKVFNPDGSLYTMYNGDLPDAFLTVENGGPGAYLIIGDSVTSIGDYAFSDCYNFIGALVFPNSVTSIGDYAFYNCQNFMGDLHLPPNLISIGIGAFAFCFNLSGIFTLPQSLTSIGDYVLAGINIIDEIYCYTTLNAFSQNSLSESSITTIHTRTSDDSWTAGANQTIFGKEGITVIKDL